ncbi:hypothetical protein [uncultured Sulfitobacter sp.]|uniref:hypothetical protein n=1 Tax=uncultured Sulfitobacter sp. TaxID=191468 RepID=UPI0030DB42DD|tara:strand:+ start:1088 stop:1555 length:468 start_codon:yes stop_codon:yes gene_type:complete
MGKSGRQLAKEAVERLVELIAEREQNCEYLPLHPGGTALHLGNICKLVAVLRTTVNTNDDFRARLKEYANRHGLEYSIKGQVAPEEHDADEKQPVEPMIAASRLREVNNRLAAVERNNVELRAENASLRSQLMRRDEVAELIALGGRIAPGELDL